MDIGHLSGSVKLGVIADHPHTAVSAAPMVVKSAPVITASAPQQPNSTASQSQVGQALQSINKALQTLSPNLEFSIDTESNRTIVRVMDQSTNEVIRQMPTQEALEISKALDKLQGLLVRQKA